MNILIVVLQTRDCFLLECEFRGAENGEKTILSFLRKDNSQ